MKPKPGSPLYTPDIASCRHLSLTTNDGNGTVTGYLTKKTLHEVGKLTLLQSKEQAKGNIFTYDPEDDVASITHFEILSRLDAKEKIFVLFTPLTGKKHQLRLHSAFLLGAPIIGDHRYGYPQDDGGAYSTREEDGVYKDGYALHCYRVAGTGDSVQFDFTAEFPGGRWGEVWNDVREEIMNDDFATKVRKISKEAKEVFAQEEIQRVMLNPKAWTKGIRGPLVKNEIS